MSDEERQRRFDEVVAKIRAAVTEEWSAKDKTGRILIDYLPMGSRGIDNGATAELKRIAEATGESWRTLETRRSVEHFFPSDNPLYGGFSYSVRRSLSTVFSDPGDARSFLQALAAEDAPTPSGRWTAEAARERAELELYGDDEDDVDADREDEEFDDESEGDESEGDESQGDESEGDESEEHADEERDPDEHRRDPLGAAENATPADPGTLPEFPNLFPQTPASDGARHRKHDQRAVAFCAELRYIIDRVGPLERELADPSFLELGDDERTECINRLLAVRRLCTEVRECVGSTLVV